MKSIISFKRFVFLVLVFGIAACQNNSSDPEFNYQNTSTLKTDTAKSNVQGDSGSNLGATTATTPTTQAKTTTSNTVLNPEHGKPGHRCDIAVGAPLNSKATNTPTPTIQQNQQQTVTTNQTVTTSQSTAGKTTTAPGMNPPHGEPGHRCDITVGAPLNSKPASISVDSAKK